MKYSRASLQNLPSMSGLLLSLKIAVIITTILFFSVILLNFVTWLKYDRTINDVVSERFLVIGQDLLQTVSNGLDLGLSLKELQTTQAVIENIKKSDAQILSISVFSLEKDESGKVLYNTRHAGIGGTTPKEWIQSLKAHLKDRNWSIDEEGNAALVGVTIFNNFKEPLGGIVVRYDQSLTNEKSLSFFQHLFLYSLLALGMGAVIVLMFSYFIFRIPGQIFSSLKDSLQTFLNNHMEKKNVPSVVQKYVSTQSTSHVEITYVCMMQKAESLWGEIEHIDQIIQNYEDYDVSKHE